MDIVEQLRKSANTIYSQDGYTFRLGLHNEAANEIERLREKLIKEREDNLWNAYNTGAERSGEWSHCFMSDGEWLVRELGLDPFKCHYSINEIKAGIPIAARAALKEGE